MVNRPRTARIACGLCVCYISLGIARSDKDFQTVDELRKKAISRQSAQVQDGAGNRLKLDLPHSPASSPGICPDPVDLDLFRHRLAYQKTEMSDWLKGLSLIHVDVWERGPLTVFYIRERLYGFIPTVRIVYPFANHDTRGAFTCSIEQGWKECIKQTVGAHAANAVPRTCTTVVDMHTIPAWKPSRNDETKRWIADELRDEIETKWPGAEEIVIRDFNMKDSQITMYLKMPDGDYFQGCGFHALRQPHCEDWHLFGNAPASSLRKWIFERPYRLK